MSTPTAGQTPSGRIEGSHRDRPRDRPKSDVPTAIAYALIGLGVVVGWLLYSRLKPHDFVPAPGVSVFALLYIFAQAIERTLEPVSELFAEDKRHRSVLMWGVACLLAMLASGALGVFLLHAVGLSTVPPAVDIGVTGLAIGSGTKPLHDLISNIQASQGTNGTKASG